jgi:predicted ATPase
MNEQSSENIEANQKADFSVHPDLVFPSKIYGRVSQQESIHNSLLDFDSNTTGLINVTGEPGIGKSFFINHVFSELPQYDYHLGKYERFQQGVPYLGIRLIIESIIKRNQDLGAEHFAKWVTEFRFRFTENYGELVSIVPSAVMLWEVQMEVKIEHNSPSALQNRINRFLGNFFKFVVTKSSKPVILFLDNLQWCDRSSKRFILKLAEKKLSGLLLILASRSAEITNEKNKDDLADKLNLIEGNQRLSLSSLSRVEIKGLLDELFPNPEADLDQLLNYLFDHSAGNPYALNESLSDLSRSGKLTYDSKNKKWSWQLEDENSPIDDRPLSGLLRDKLLDLKDENQKILQISSCFGTNLNIPFISRISGIEQHRLRATFQQAVALGFLVQSHTSGQHGVPEASNYEFAHDMAQESVQSTFEESESRKIHYKIATYFIEESFLGLSDRDVYDAVYHLNEAVEDTWSQEELQTHAEVNLRAAKKAHSTASFSLASNYLSQLFSNDRHHDWEYRYSFAAEAHTFGYQIARLNTNDVLADQLYQASIKFMKPLELAKLRLVKTMLDIQFGELVAAIKTGVKALKDLGINVPFKAGKVAVVKEFLRTKIVMRGKTLDSIYELPKMKNNEAETAFNIIFWLFRAAHSINPELNGVLALKELQLTLKYGTNGEAYSGLMAYGVIIGAGTNNYKSAYEYCELGSKIATKYKYKSGGLEFGRAIYSAYRFPLRDSLPQYERSKKISYDTGDFLAAAEPTVNESLTLYSVGMPLKGVEIKIKESVAFCKELKMTDFYEFQVAMLYHLKRIKGDVLKDGEEEEFNRIIEKTEYNVLIAVGGIFSLQYECLQGNWKQAIQQAKKCKKDIQFLAGLYFQTEYYFYRAVAQLKSYKSLDISSKIKIKRSVNATLKKMRKWADSAPENHAHRLLIIEGLFAQAQGDSAKAEELLMKAAEEAEEFIFTQNAALAHWFLFDFYAEEGKSENAQRSFTNAMEHFKIWGTKLLG